ncbi:MAG: hypothetical protein E6G36_06740 [Actinobacteria bacterium]|nr:MAG: hypothetical protein E6G36_06740 [Actinomycetota bacterium]
MHDLSLSQGERGYVLLLEHCAALTRVSPARTPAFERLEEALGGDLTRLLLVALARRRAARVSI